MDRRVFLSALCASLACASAGYAASYEDAVVAQLRAQGYGKISTERTLLGRVRILARMGATSREIILNPRTGEILRDIVLDAQGNMAPQIAGGSSSSTTGSSGAAGSNDDRPEEEDPPEDPDEEHETGGNSGSGSGGGSSGGSGSRPDEPDENGSGEDPEED